ncbi:Serine/threonine-protein kinase domain-containing protein 4 [Rozella allomycis CSF55]|uniref:Serine/threonine-protein kinase domain-containing protein 4 n=1 Tax=Rozella allomycis (strain CSF55) TaxID=988480 RepID=A0A075AZL2_ROZAC|nr:Serine/threonine-protein kinase domain-containing protein 4 [Rozella allomycis CSF55]|eukprot:EPZ34024.1 Serine/threonine-protein kinase domain-containing protein 4 [Rozella allomycis CSF55]
MSKLFFFLSIVCWCSKALCDLGCVTDGCSAYRVFQSHLQSEERVKVAIKDDITYAYKVIPRKFYSHAIDEVKNYQALKNIPGIAQMRCCSLNVNGDSIIITDFFPNGDLLRPSKTFTQKQLQLIAAQSIVILKGLTDRNYLHLDIKPQNFVMDGEHLSLIDMETAIDLNLYDVPLRRGTFDTMSNPMFAFINGQRPAPYSPEFDMFSLAQTLLWVLVHNEFPELNWKPFKVTRLMPGKWERESNQIPFNEDLCEKHGDMLELISDLMDPETTYEMAMQSDLFEGFDWNSLIKEMQQRKAVRSYRHTIGRVPVEKKYMRRTDLMLKSASYKYFHPTTEVIRNAVSKSRPELSSEIEAEPVDDLESQSNIDILATEDAVDNSDNNDIEVHSRSKNDITKTNRSIRVSELVVTDMRSLDSRDQITESGQVI